VQGMRFSLVGISMGKVGNYIWHSKSSEMGRLDRGGVEEGKRSHGSSPNS